MTKFFTKNDNNHSDDKNKTHPTQKEVYPRQQEDVTEASVSKRFKNKGINFLIGRLGWKVSRLL